MKKHVKNMLKKQKNKTKTKQKNKAWGASLLQTCTPGVQL